MKSSNPKTGDIYLADFEPVRGSEQGMQRPVIVFQNPDLSRFTSTFICIPLTTTLSRVGLPGTCFIRKGVGNLPQDSVALCFQMRAIDKVRLGNRYGTVNTPTLNALGDAILSALGIDIEKI